MLLGLTIRDVVLIDRLTLAFRPGLCVLTGETGAGKSILLDALGLALGRRADAAWSGRGPSRRSSAPSLPSRTTALPRRFCVTPVSRPISPARSCCAGWSPPTAAA